MRAPGRIDTGGDRAISAALAEAFLAAASDDVVAESLTHPVHSYPARLHPATARALVELIGDRVPTGAALLDPFCGSGTTLVEARALGVPAVGVDLNPLAVRLARVKTWTAPVPRRRAARDLGLRIAADVMASGKDARRAGFSPQPMRAPDGFDPNARQRRIGKWFAPHVRRELEAIAAAIDEVRADDAELAEVFTIALSAVLYKVSNRTSDTDGTWTERHVARGAAARWFGDRVAMIIAGLDDLAVGRMPPTPVFEADARTLTSLALPKIGGVITSPPYAGTYDYADHHRLRFDFLGIRHRAFDEGELGSRRGFASNSLEAARQWKAAQFAWLGGVADVMMPRAWAAFVIGDSVVGARAIYADEDLQAVFDDRLAVVAWASQERPMLGAAERRAFGDRPKREHVVIVERRADPGP
ncbi:MAG: DNA methyltransferase [Kofleriaceae bacterium]